MGVYTPVCGHFECMYVFLAYVFLCVCLFAVFVVTYYCVPCVLWLSVFCVCYMLYVRVRLGMLCVPVCVVCVFGGWTALRPWCLHSTRPGPRRMGHVRQGPVPRSAQHRADDTGALTPVPGPRGDVRLGWGRRPRASIPGRVLQPGQEGSSQRRVFPAREERGASGFTSRCDYRPQMTDYTAAHSMQWLLPSHS